MGLPRTDHQRLGELTEELEKHLQGFAGLKELKVLLARKQSLELTDNKVGGVLGYNCLLKHPGCYRSLYGFTPGPALHVNELGLVLSVACTSCADIEAGRGRRPRTRYKDPVALENEPRGPFVRGTGWAS